MLSASASSSRHILSSSSRSISSLTRLKRPSNLNSGRIYSLCNSPARHASSSVHEGIDIDEGPEANALLGILEEPKPKGSKKGSYNGKGHISHNRRLMDEMKEGAAPEGTKLQQKNHALERLKKKREIPKSFAPKGGKALKKWMKREIMAANELLQSAGSLDFEMKAESWTEEWGEDRLKPTSEKFVGSESNMGQLPTYVRRVEGLIEHSEKDVLEELEPSTGKVPIATLAHGLDRTLFNPGIHWVQDPRSRVYNFTPFIQNVPDIKDFAFERLTPFTRSSRDKVMRELAMSKGKRFGGSTSSLTGLLCHIYFLLSEDHLVDVSTLAQPFNSKLRTFTPGQRMPTALVFNHHDGVYMIDSDSTDNDDTQWNVLMWMGTMLENFFTLPKDKFGKLLRSVTAEHSIEKEPGAYRYSQSEKFVMRSQLDSVDSRLPGSGVFDIKTRAALPIRMDNLNFKENSGYIINALHGSFNSFDREYYDLIRSAFLKYSFQVRIGGMDGIFLAYHNTARVFGFQYIPLEEMDRRLFGTRMRRDPEGQGAGLSTTGGEDVGWRVFQKCVGMLEAVSAEIIECFPGKTVACVVEKQEGFEDLKIWVQPVEDKPQPESEAEELPEVDPNLKKPIIQLDIKASSFLDGKPAGGSDAVLSELPWTVRWSISRSSLPDYFIRQNLEGAKQRKYRPKAYPTGVNKANLEDFVKNLGFGDPEAVPNSKNFRRPDAMIRLLRKVSRAGLAETKRLETEDEAKEKQIWQQVEFSDPDYHRAFPSDKNQILQPSTVPQPTLKPSSDKLEEVSPPETP